jgi:uncharacterized protein
LEFEWDEEKALSNFRKHGISFKEAKTIFNDPYALTIPDPDHSILEERWIDIGLSAEFRVLYVVYTERRDVTRIISSRLATTKERKTYEQSKSRLL